MNIYEDYVSYIGEKEQLLLYLKNNVSKVYLLLDDCVKVLDYIYKKFQDGAKIDMDMEEIFDLGFGYLSNTLNDINTYFEDYFKKDFNLLNKYGTLIFYSIYIEDLKGFLDAEELLIPERVELIDKASTLIDNIMVNMKPLDISTEKQIEALIDGAMPSLKLFKPTYSVFSLIAEELDLI